MRTNQYGGRRWARAAATLAAAGLWVGAGTAQAGSIPVDFQPVAVGGQAAPGTGGAMFNTNQSTFSNPLINAVGDVAFSATLLQAGPVNSTNDLGVWAGPPSALVVATREGTMAPGAGGALFGASQTVLGLGHGGQVAVRSSLAGAGVITSGSTANSVGVWTGLPGSLGLLARENSAAPGLGGALFGVGGFTSAALTVNPAGQTAFFANLRTAVAGVTTANDRTLWTGAPGSLTLVAREGFAAPGTAGANFNVLPSTVALNSAGNVAFTGSLTGGDSVTGVNNSGLWVGPAGGLSLAVRQGDAAPGTGSGLFGSVLDPTLNSAGRVMFRGSITGAGVDSTNDAGLWSGLPGSLDLVARKGDAAPGVASGVFTGVGLNTRLYSGSDRVVFNGSANDGGASDRFGLWHGVPGSISKIAVTGDTAPGIAGGVFESTFGGVSSNGVGQVAFTALVSGAGVDATNDLGLFVADPFGGLELILRKGELFDVDADPMGVDLRTISDIRLAGGSAVVDGRSAAFNDDGLLALQLFFTDSTAAVVTARIPLIPAPSGAALLGLAAAAVSRRRR
ncbi:MAG: choice-of-anchor tandem repeat NxxGxxAF-containing protein [Phycisphaerales bacterium]